AIVEQFNAVADGAGRLTIQFVTIKDNAKLSGIEILTGSLSAPGVPTGPAAAAGNASVTLSWTASTGAAGYNVYRGTRTGGEGVTRIASSITATLYTDTAIANGTTYYYRVTAVNSAGESARSSEVSATPQLPVPGAPTGLTAAPGNGQINLAWTAPA